MTCHQNLGRATLRTNHDWSHDCAVLRLSGEEKYEESYERYKMLVQNSFHGLSETCSGQDQRGENVHRTKRDKKKGKQVETEVVNSANKYRGVLAQGNSTASVCITYMMKAFRMNIFLYF